jgi:predicted nucleic acid-binding protein
MVSGLRRLLEPHPLGRQISRDAKDDPYLACALQARAEFIVSRDQDLLTMGKPFGIEILTPRAFLRRVAALSLLVRSSKQPGLLALAKKS